jgi:SAM-dependent methyltransferase
MNPEEGQLARELYARRFDPDERESKSAIWRVLCKSFFQRYVSESDTVLDLGAGYCEFINNIRCKKKLAVDLNEETRRFADPDVEVVISPLNNMPHLDSCSVDLAFASNVFEHLPNKETLLESLAEIRRVLKPGGRLMILQPNIRYAYREYWDFFDHHLALSHVSLSEALGLSGFVVRQMRPCFLPYSTKSRLPKLGVLVRLYILLRPLHRIFGKQMFLLATRSGD